MDNENLQPVSMEELANAWDDLRHNSFKKGNIILEDFTKIFTDTYEVLKELTPAESIPKTYMSLILSAACFAKMSLTGDDKRLRAALVLTERMLHYCVSGDRIAALLPECALIYSPNMRKEIVVYFNDVDGAISEIIGILD